MRIFAALSAFAVFMASSPVSAGQAMATEVIEKVRAAAALIEREGASGIATIADPASGYMWKDTYVFVVDCDADRVMANPAFPERVGGDIKQHTDYAGFRYGPQLCETASQPGGGWIEYHWAPAGGGEAQRKVSYVVSVPGRSYQVGAGIYDAEASLSALAALTAGEPGR